MTSYISSLWLLLFVRLLLGCVMMYYGWPKVRDLKANARDFVQMGFRPGILWGTVVALVEFAGGFLVFIGFIPELMAAFFAFQMLVGFFWKVRIKKPFTDYSYDLQLFGLCMVVMFFGAGPYAVHEYPGDFFRRWGTAVLTLGGAFLLAFFVCRPAVDDSRRQQAA